MDVALHLGAHCTDDGQLVAALLKNRDALAERGVVVPYPARYRRLVRETIHTLQGAPASPDMQEALLDAITEHDRVDRLVLSSDNLLAAAHRALGPGGFYPMAAEKTRWFRMLFPDARCSFHLAIRNPAAFLPALFGRLRDTSYDSFIAGTDPLVLRWSECIGRIRAANPDAGVVVWCDEDTALIWPEVMRALAGVAADMPLEGETLRLSGLMNRHGLDRLRDYLADHPPPTVEHRRRIVAAFLDKYALDEALEEDADLPGWTHDYVEALTDAYEDDVAEIATMDGVTLLSA